MSRRISTPTVISWSALLLAWFSFLFGSWNRQDSGMQILLDMFQMWVGPGMPAGATRQMSVLGSLVMLLILLACATLSLFRLQAGEQQWLAPSVATPLAMVAVLGVLYFYFGARTSGVVICSLAAAILAASTFLAHSQPASAPPSMEAAPEAEALTLQFQKDVAKQYHTCRKAGKPFTLGMIGINHFEDHATVFGDPAADEMTEALEAYLVAYSADTLMARFSGGSLMVGFPELTVEEAEKAIAQVGEEMDSHGFAGEMLLPDGAFRLRHFLASGQSEQIRTLSELTESVLSGYAGRPNSPISQEISGYEPDR